MLEIFQKNQFFDRDHLFPRYRLQVLFQTSRLKAYSKHYANNNLSRTEAVRLSVTEGGSGGSGGSQNKDFFSMPLISMESWRTQSYHPLMNARSD